MALTWTTVEDVKSRWVGEGAIPASDPQIAALLEDAEDTIIGEYPTIQTRIDDASLPLRRVQKVAARLVIRHLRNPGGIRSTQQGAGPYQESLTYGGNEPGGMFLNDDDRAELGGITHGSAFTIDSTPIPKDTDPTYIGGPGNGYYDPLYYDPLWEPLS